MVLKKGQKQGRDEKLKKTTLLRNDASLLSDLQCNALASLVHFVVCKVDYECKFIALDTKKEATIIP